MTTATGTSDGWQRHLRRDIGLLLLFKVVALLVLRVLFFSGEGSHADGAAVAERLAVAAPALASAAEGRAP